mmetsp:Transcript_13387/g.34133  ORF Transcript_13387/g.34133 Transcript_13387/m.34133 type:complete len:121 (-) Transcript_13387:462-824(-)
MTLSQYHLLSGSSMAIGLNIRTVKNKKLTDTEGSGSDSNSFVKRRFLKLVANVGVGAMLKQKLHNCFNSTGSSVVKRCLAMLVAGVDVHPSSDHQFQHPLELLIPNVPHYVVDRCGHLVC